MTAHTAGQWVRVSKSLRVLASTQLEAQLHPVSVPHAIPLNWQNISKQVQEEAYPSCRTEPHAADILSQVKFPGYATAYTCRQDLP
jgi:hypothetical protein